MRRRLKRDANGSAQRQSDRSYASFLAPPLPQGLQVDPRVAVAPPDDSEVRACETPHQAPQAPPHGGTQRLAACSGLVGLCVEEVMGEQGAESVVGQRGEVKSGSSEVGVGDLFECELVTSSCIVVGSLSIGASALVFWAKAAKEGAAAVAAGGRASRALQRLQPCRRWPLAQIVRAEGRRYMLRATALEVSFADGSAVLVNFPGDTCNVPTAGVTQVYRRLCLAISALPISRLRLRFLSDPSSSLRYLFLPFEGHAPRVSPKQVLTRRRCLMTGAMASHKSGWSAG